jgi:drug/metabolite transporter (DMT)-like permease
VQSPTPTRFSPSVIAAAATTIVLWGSAFAGIRAGLQAYSPAHLAVLRYLSASLVLVIFALLTRMRRPARHDLPLIFLLGLVGFAFYNLALNTGEQSVPAGPASVLIQTIPIWTALLATLFLRERLRVWGWLGIAISFTGVVVIALGQGEGFQWSMGAALILLAAVSSSVYIIIQKHMLARYRPAEITTYAIWAGTLLLLPFASGLVGAVQAAPIQATLAVVYLGIGPAALAYITWAYALSRLPAARAVSLLYAVPVVAFLVGWAWLGETPNGIDLLGGLLALSGVVVVNTLGRARAQQSR